MIRVYLAEGDPEIRRGAGERIGAAPDLRLVGAGGVHDLVPGAVPRVDVLVADVRLHDAAAVLAIRRVRAAHPRTRTLLWTCYEDDEAVLAALVTGARGYALKQLRGDGLVRAVRDVAAGAVLLDPRITAHVLQRLRRHPRGPALTDAEYALLERAAAGATDRQIARAIGAGAVDVARQFAAIATRVVAYGGDRVAHLVEHTRGTVPTERASWPTNRGRSA